MTDTSTATTSGLQTYFKQSTIFGIDPSLILGFSIAWSLRTSISLHIKAIKRQKVFFGFKQSFFVGLWAVFATSRRVLSIVVFFLPSLGLMDILHHHQSEQYTFSIKMQYNLIHPKDQVHLFNLTERLLWSELDRWNYYEDPEEPIAPSYTLYTGFNLKWSLILFFFLMFFQFAAIFYSKYGTSKEFKEDRLYNKCIHVLQNLNFSFPMTDWDEGMFTREEFRTRYNNIEVEMACALAVNIAFSFCMVIPVLYTGEPSLV